MQKITQFLREAWAELSRVVWPTRQQTLHYTILVVIISIATAIFLGVLDFLFGTGISNYINPTPESGVEAPTVTAEPIQVEANVEDITVEADVVEGSGSDTETAEDTDAAEEVGENAQEDQN